MFIEQLSDDQRYSISDINRRRLAASLVALRDIFNQLLNGQIIFSDFIFLKSFEDKVLELCTVSSDLSEKKAEIKAMMKQRERQRNLFLRFHELISDLWQASSSAVLGKYGCYWLIQSRESM